LLEQRNLVKSESSVKLKIITGLPPANPPLTTHCPALEKTKLIIFTSTFSTPRFRQSCCRVIGKGRFLVDKSQIGFFFKHFFAKTRRFVICGRRSCGARRFMFLAPAAIFVDTIVWHQQYLVAPNDFDHFGTCLKASQLLAPEFQPLRLDLYTATAIFAPPRSVDLSYETDQKI